MKLLLVTSLLACIAFCQAVFMDNLKTCMTDAECSTGQCCAKPVANPIMSRRDVAATVSTAGSCMDYHLEGHSCSPFSKPNGFCGCAPGLQCTLHRTGGNKRSMINPKFGSMLCTRV